MTPVHRNVPYAASGHPRCTGDLFLPAGEARGVPVLLIHGGGWKALDKEGFAFMAPFFLAAGHPVFNIDYRLLGDAPWPACGDDCLTAGHFLLAGGLADAGLPAAESLIVCGASAGGHLAMMTGLRLPRAAVKAILVMAGPSRLDWVASTRDPIGLGENFLPQFFGRALHTDAPEVREASPALRAEPHPPPLHCLHSRNDRLVPVAHSEEARRAWQRGGGHAEVTVFDGDGDLHGFWIADERDRLRPEVGSWVARCLAQNP